MKSLNILALAIITPALAGGALAYTGEKLAKTAKVTMEQATDIALKARPGKITDKELEGEKGGTGLRSYFDVRHKGITYNSGSLPPPSTLVLTAPDAPPPTAPH